MAKKLTTEQLLSNFNNKHGNKYDYSKVNYINAHTKITIICSTHGEFEQTPNEHKKGRGCSDCGLSKIKRNNILKRKTTEQFILESNIIHDNKYKYYETEYINNKTEVVVTCPTHGNFTVRPDEHLFLKTGCSKCNSNISRPEQQLIRYISDIYDGNVTRYKDKKYEIDIYIPQLNLGFEFNGIYYHSSDFKSKRYHKDKSIYFNEKGILLIHIWEDDWSNKKDLVKSMINHKLNISNRIFARKCKLKYVTSRESKDFLDKNHLRGGKYAKSIGLFHNSELLSILSYKMLNNTLEIDRFATKKNNVVIGGFSKLLKEIITNIKPLSIITYADIDINNNYKNSVYYKNGFLFVGVTEPSFFYINSNLCRYSRNKFQKHKLKKLFPNSYDDSISADKIVRYNGYYKIYNSGNFKFKMEII